MGSLPILGKGKTCHIYYVTFRLCLFVMRIQFLIFKLIAYCIFYNILYYTKWLQSLKGKYNPVAILMVLGI